MTYTGMADIMSGAFAGIPKMLSGKKCPQNILAIRMVAEELLRKIFHSNSLQFKEDLMSLLEELASKSRTTKLWLDVVIKPVFIMMMYVRAEIHCSAKCDVRLCIAISSGNSCRQPRLNFTEHPTSSRGGGVGADRHLCGV